MEKQEQTQRYGELRLHLVGSEGVPLSPSDGVPFDLFETLPGTLADFVAGSVRLSREQKQEALVRFEVGSLNVVARMRPALYALLVSSGLSEDLVRIRHGKTPLDPVRSEAVSRLQKYAENKTFKTFDFSVISPEGVVVAESGMLNETPLLNDSQDFFSEEEATLIGTAYDIGGKVKTNIHITDLSTQRDFIVQATREAVEFCTRPYARLRLLVRYRRNLRTGEGSDYKLIKLLPAVEPSDFEKALEAAIERGTRAWKGINHRQWIDEMRAD